MTMEPEAKLKIGKFYRVLDNPVGNVRGYKEGPGYNELVWVRSKTLVFITKWEHFTKKMDHEVLPCLDNLYYQTICGEDFIWLHPYDLVEVDGEGMPIVPNGF